MSRQDMQFEDRRQQSQNETEAAYEAYEPRQVNRDPREQPRSAEGPGDGPGYEPGYMGQRQNYGEKIQPGARRSRQRKRQSGWGRMLAIGVIVLVLIGGASTLFRVMGIGWTSEKIASETFTNVPAQTTLSITNSTGDINVRTGDGDEVTIDAIANRGWGGENPEVSFEQVGNTIEVTIEQDISDWFGGDIDFDVIVPETMNLTLHSTTGDINVEGNDGVFDLYTNTGDITVDQAELQGTGRLETNTGDVNFEGTFGENATYTMKANTGDVDLKLDPNENVAINAVVNTGDIESDIPEIVVSEDGPVSRVAEGQIGPGEGQAHVSLETNTGDVNIE